MLEFFTKLFLTLLHSEQPKLYRVLAVLSAIGLKTGNFVLATFIGFVITPQIPELLI